MGEKALDAKLYYETINGYEPCAPIKTYKTLEDLTFTSVAERIINRLERVLPKRILKSGNRTIVFWEDGTKTIVKRAEDEAESDYAAFTAALGIKLFGSNSALKKLIESKTEVQKPKKQKEED